jgi:hypothetical protein
MSSCLLHSLGEIGQRCRSDCARRYAAPPLRLPFYEFQGCPRFGRHCAEPSLPSLHNNLARGTYDASGILRRNGGIAVDARCA